MSEWYDSHKKPSSNFRKLLQERPDKTNTRRKLAKDETIKLAKLEGIAENLKRGENVQNHQLAIWLTKDGYKSRNSQNSFTQQHDDPPFSQTQKISCCFLTIYSTITHTISSRY